ALGASFHCLFLLGHPSPIGHLLRSSVQSRSRNMVSSEAKNGFNCVSCGTFRGGEARPRAIRQTRTPPERLTFRETRRVRRSNERCGSPIGPVANRKYKIACIEGLVLTLRAGSLPAETWE